MTIREMPPMLTGDVRKDMYSMRDYLFRLASTLDPAISAEVAEQTTKAARQYSAGQGGGQVTADDLRRNAQELKSLIIKSAKELTDDMEEQYGVLVDYCDTTVEEYGRQFVARSEYGEFTETIDTRITTSAVGVVESYNYGASITSLQAASDLMQSYLTTINGEIRRGLIQDPDSGEYVTGIAIAQSLQFSGEVRPGDAHHPGDGNVYYQIDTNQTFGLYTATGWQFWLNGHKRGWFDSADGMLHVTDIVVERSLQLSGTWKIELSSDGQTLDIRYIG